MRLLLFVATWLLLATQINAKDITKRVKGYGIDEQSAISAALLEAVSEVNGVSVDSLSNIRSHLIELDLIDSDAKHAHISAKVQSGDAMLKATNGIVKSFTLLSMHPQDKGFEATLDVTLRVYKAADESYKNRKKLAIMPFHLLVHSNELPQTIAGDILTERLQSVLIHNFMRSKELTLLDRSYMRDMSRELGLINHGGGAMSEKVKLGQKLGADYLLVGTIERLIVKSKTTHNQSLGTTVTTHTLNTKISYRVIIVGTSHILYANSVTFSLPIKEDEPLLDNLLDVTSRNISSDILATLYPKSYHKLERNTKEVVKKDDPSWRKSDVKVSEGGGVKLGF